MQLWYREGGSNRRANNNSNKRAGGKQNMQHNFLRNDVNDIHWVSRIYAEAYYFLLAKMILCTFRPEILSMEHTNAFEMDTGRSSGNSSYKNNFAQKNRENLKCAPIIFNFHASRCTPEQYTRLVHTTYAQNWRLSLSAFLLSCRKFNFMCKLSGKTEQQIHRQTHTDSIFIVLKWLSEGDYVPLILFSRARISISVPYKHINCSSKHIYCGNVLECMLLDSEVFTHIFSVFISSNHKTSQTREQYIKLGKTNNMQNHIS